MGTLVRSGNVAFLAALSCQLQKSNRSQLRGAHKPSGFCKVSSREILGQLITAASPFWGSRIMNDEKVYENLAVPEAEIQRQVWIALFFLHKNHLFIMLPLVALWNHHKCKKANRLMSIRG